jgi:hypothetical protein
MASLATPDDVALRFSFSSSDSDLVDQLLDAASARVRRYTRRPFALGEVEGERHLSDGTVVLRQWPVVEVTAVRWVAVPPATSVTVGASWEQVGSTVIYLPVGEVEVDYTYGSATIPADVIDVVAGMVARRMSSGISPGLRSLTVGGVSETYDDSAASGSMAFTAEDRETLDAYRVRRVGTVTT